MAEGVDSLAVYIHWPYCARICPYCDFNVYKARQDDHLIGAILKDLSYWRNWSGPRAITSVHFGGGTPSLLPSASLAKITAHVDELWGVSTATEIAIEANPNDCDDAQWRKMANAGVTRVSLGVQTFIDDTLNFLGRDHSAAAAQTALAAAINIFPSVSLDLIFGWAEQTAKQWNYDLERAVASGADHVSAYQLTIEPGTAFAQMEARGQSKSVDEMQSADFYEAASKALLAAGFEHYEVSNFARPGHHSRHNLSYWQGEDYVGVGPGAHGRLTRNGQRTATIAALRPKEYQERVNQTGSGIAEKEALSATAWAEEYILMGLRISAGLCLQKYADISGSPLSPARLRPFIEDGYLIQKEGRLFAAPKGRLVLNHITEKLLVG